MIPGVIRRIHEAKTNDYDTITIWGNGETRREFMYAGDLADFVSENIDKIEKLPQNMNIGLGTDYSIKEYYEVIAKIVGYEGYFEYDLSKPEGMKQKLVDIKEQKKLGWEPKISLYKGISNAYNHYLEMYE